MRARVCGVRRVQLPNCASDFHALAADIITANGFGIDREPGSSGSPYGGQNVRYRHENGLYMHVGFEIWDGASAACFFGRIWRFGPKLNHFSFSNNFHFFADHFDLEFKEHFSHNEKNLAHEAILGGLADTLPTIIKRIDNENLQEIENLGFGAAAQYKRYLEFHSIEYSDVEISPF